VWAGQLYHFFYNTLLEDNASNFEGIKAIRATEETGEDRIVLSHLE
jgi:hypothetical protein